MKLEECFGLFRTWFICLIEKEDVISRDWQNSYEFLQEKGSFRDVVHVNNKIGAFWQSFTEKRFFSRTKRMICWTSELLPLTLSCYSKGKLWELTIQREAFESVCGLWGRSHTACFLQTGLALLLSAGPFWTVLLGHPGQRPIQKWNTELRITPITYIYHTSRFLLT